MPLPSRLLPVRHFLKIVSAATLTALLAAVSSCTDSDSSMHTTAIELASVKAVTAEMLSEARLRNVKVEPDYGWAFQRELFWLERAEATPLPEELVQSIFGKTGATPWIRGKWSISPDGGILTLREVSGENGLAIDETTLPFGLAALMQVTLDGTQYTLEEGGAKESPLYKSGQPVAFKDRTAASEQLWGFRDPVTGEVIIPPVFSKASDFSTQGVACVLDGQEPYIINPKGERLVQPLWINDKPDSFREGLARCISEDGRMGYFNAYGEITIPGQWTYAEPFSNGLALVNNDGTRKADGTVEGGLWGAIDDLGQIVLKIDFGQLERGPGHIFRTSSDEPWFRPGSMSGE
ncbi:MAG: hypothetical protein ACI9R3_001019 [Verrucomicrobiales bacterium]|jgi:hypothetical protein